MQILAVIINLCRLICYFLDHRRLQDYLSEISDYVSSQSFETKPRYSQSRIKIHCNLQFSLHVVTTPTTQQQQQHLLQHSYYYNQTDCRSPTGTSLVLRTASLTFLCPKSNEEDY